MRRATVRECFTAEEGIAIGLKEEQSFRGQLPPIQTLAYRLHSFLSSAFLLHGFVIPEFLLAKMYLLKSLKQFFFEKP